MTYDLFIGDYTYSTWSMRAWLLFDRFGIAHCTRLICFDDGLVPDLLPEIAPARTVPAIRMPDGTVISETMAIAEELATRHPDLPLWPSDPHARATARSLACEMHASFMALRGACPMNLRKCYTDFAASDAVMADLDRIETLWEHARQTCGAQGPWLCGEYGIVDAMYAPVAARIAGYRLKVSASARAYVDAHLAEPSFRRWRALALGHGPELARYRMALASTNWPGDPPEA